MALVASGPETSDQPTFQVVIGNERPISAEDIGRLVSELGRDYHRQTGSHLVMTNLELGSTLIDFMDVAAVYTGYASIFLVPVEVTERLKQFYGRLKKQLVAPVETLVAASSPFNPSTERLLEIAANSGANLKISKGSGSSKQVIELTHVEVERRNKAAKKAKKKTRKAKDSTGQVDAVPPPLPLASITEQLRAQSQGDPGQLHNAVLFITRFLQSNGWAGQLPQLAKSLETNGLWEAARIVRSQIGSGGGPLNRD